MRLRDLFMLVLVGLVCVTSAAAAPSYRSFIEWNGPYYHVRHALNADSSAYLSYLVNNPLPLYSAPFSSPTALALYGSSVSPTAFVVDHDHRRVQLFSANASWIVEALGYSATPVQGYYGARSVKFSYGQVLPGSEQIHVNGRPFTRVSSLTGYTGADSVYTIVYDGVPNTGGVATLPVGWNLTAFDSIRVEYSHATPPGSPGVGEIDYVLYQTAPTDLPLQLNEATSTTDPDLSDLTSIALNGSVRGARALDIYLVNALTGGAGTLASYDLTAVGAGGVFGHVDTYPGPLGRPYDVEVADNGANIDGTIAEGTPSGCSNAILDEAVTNQNTFLGHDYRITYVFDTSSTMNQVAAPDNEESDIAYDAGSGRLHVVFCRDGVGTGTAYSYSDDYGQTWSAAITISPSTLTAAKDRPRIVIRQSGEIHVVYEAVDGLGDRHLYHTYSTDGITWAATTELTSAITPSVVAENRYANLMVDPLTDYVYVVWAGDGDVYQRSFSTSWGGITQAVSGGTAPFSAPHAVMDGVGRIYMAYVSNAAAPWEISYMVFNGAVWGSYSGGGFTAGTPDVVTAASGVASDGGGRGEAYPFPQILITGDSVWVFWIGTGTETYGVNPCDMYYNRIDALDGDFTAGPGTAITTGDDCAPMRFAAIGAPEGLVIVYPFSTTVDQEGLRCKSWTRSLDMWWPATTDPGRHLFNEGPDATTWAYEPRMVGPSICGHSTVFLTCAKTYTAIGGGSARVLLEVVDGVLKITDQTTLSEYIQWRVWYHGAPDTTSIPGLWFRISNSSDAISNTDDVDATEFNVGDYFELDGTPPVKNDLAFLTDSDNHRVKVIRTYDNIDNCFGGDERWDVPGQSDGTPSQTYKLGTIGGESSFRVWASFDSTAWTVVDNLLIAGPSDRVCEVNRYTKEIRFGDNVHGAIPPAGAYIRVHYAESVDEAEFGRMGSGAGQMSFPRGVAVQYNSNLGQFDVYTCDAGNNRLQKWAYRPNSTVDPANWTSPVAAWNTASADTDLVDAPEDVEIVSLNGEVYLVVSDNDNARLLIYRDDEATGSGGNTPPTFVESVGTMGTDLNQFIEPRGLAVLPEDSGLVIFATDADRDQVVKILQRDWLVTTAEDTGGGGGPQTNAMTLSLVDAIDNDACLLLQPQAVRTIELRVSRTDSLVALRASATFPAGMIDILSVNEGNLWSGERYTNKVFLYDYDNATGHFEVNASMVGDDDGLSTSGSRVVATLLVRADSAMAVPASGVIAFTDSSEVRKAGNRLVTSYNRASLNLRGGYLADIATTGGNPGTPPSMVPQPDGRINFADVNVFTQGWNGDGIVFDPIADIGPFLGATVPQLVADPDGRLDAHDLLSLNVMYNWYNTSVPLNAPPPLRDGNRLDDLGGPVAASARQTETGWQIELQARDVASLTSAHMYLVVETPGAWIASAQPGDFLGASHTLFLHTIQGAAADICMGRLCRENPCVSGSGVLATIDLALPADAMPEIRLVYELRDSRNSVIASGDGGYLDVQAVPEKSSLGTPYPNPFNATTTFTLNLAAGGRATVRVFNVLGQQVALIVDRELPAGVHRFAWEARDQSGAALTSGIYFVRFETAGQADIRKLVLLR